MTRLPQVLRNVRVAERDAATSPTAVAGRGRRGRGRARRPTAGCSCGPSGTEPLVRVMVEAADRGARPPRRPTALVDAVERLRSARPPTAQRLTEPVDGRVPHEPGS